MPVTVPCGRCIGCRLEKSKQWAIRISHEASLYQKNCFVTLTYNNEHLPSDGSIHLEHVQLFLKRLRKKYGNNIRYFQCGEYGEKFARPHYHLCIFNHDFHDKKHLRVTPGGQILYTSDSLASLWPFGFHSIGQLTFQSAAYVARYVTKKLTGKKSFIYKEYFSDGTFKTHNYENSDEHYQLINFDTGEVTYRAREFATMSRRPGLGSLWLQKYKRDVYPADHVIISGKEMLPPRYYDAYLEKEDISQYLEIKKRRKQKQKTISQDRLDAMEIVKIARSKSLKRNYENGSLLNQGH